MAADWLSDYAAQKAKEDAEDWRKHQQKEDLAGLGWLGLRKVESVLGSAIDGLFGWLDKGINTAWDGAKEFVNSLNTNKDNISMANTKNTQEYEIVMTDAGYARKYANGKYEYIDDVTAQAELYKDTYGGEIQLTAYQGNNGFNPNRIQEIRELQEDGSYKVTILDEEGKVAQQYYEVKKLDVSKALSYEDAMKLTGGDMKYDAVDMVRGIFVEQARLLSNLYQGDLNKQFIAVKDYLYNSIGDIYKAYWDIGVNDEDTVGNVIATVAQVLAETTTIRYGEQSGNFNYYDSGMRNAQKATYFMTNWNWGNREDPLARYNGNNGIPKLDCAAFVGLVLDIAGITNGTEGKDYNQLKGLNLQGKYNGVRNIVDSGLFKEIKPGEVKVGDLAYTGDPGYNHILIVSQTDNGNAIKYIHSSPYDYNSLVRPKTGIGVQNSPFDFKGYPIKYIRYGGFKWKK